MSDDPVPYATPVHPARDAERIRPRDVFGIIVRTTGFLIALYGSYLILWGLASLPPTSPIHADSRDYFISGFYMTFGGAALLRGGWVVFLAYGPDRASRL